MTLHLNRDIVSRTLAEIVADNGEDYVYPRAAIGDAFGSCVYAEDLEHPSCIVGHLIYRIDPDTFQQIAESDSANHEGVSGIVSEYGDYNFGTVDEDVSLLDALTNLQDQQDTGSTWGNALWSFNLYLKDHPID